MNRLAALLSVMFLSACVAVPHSVEPTIEEAETVVLPAEKLLVTVGSRRFLASMEKAIANTTRIFRLSTRSHSEMQPSPREGGP